MSAPHVQPEANSTQSLNTEDSCPSPFGCSQNAQKNSGPSKTSLVYEGFTFFKADPMPKQSPTWACVERTAMNLSQDERAHINQLIDEQRRSDPHVEWSCVYAKEHTKPSKARNARRADYETISMDVILMQRPMKSQAYPRTPMGDLVDLGKPFHPKAKLPSIWSPNAYNSLAPGQDGNTLRSIPQVLRSQFAPLSHPFVGPREQRREPTQSTATINNGPGSPAFSPKDSGDLGLEHISSTSSESSSDSDDASVMFDQSDDTCATDDSEGMETEIADCRPRPAQTYLRRTVSPHRRDASFGPHLHQRPQSRSLDRKHDRSRLFRAQHEAVPVKSFAPVRGQRARSRGSASGKIYRMQLMDDNEARSRMLDYREASIGHREKRLKRTFSEALQSERRQTVKDIPTVCRCTCRCAIRKRETV
ncbi:hypothetical protein N7475_009541 [Penicillium sp. IBT 31633x]|nr:hypothetical protein N7475_009541 [Penicillium sp. IBT 31633x]